MTTTGVKFSNFASTTLVGTYGTGDTALTVASAAAFPAISVGTSWFYAVITDSLTAPTKREIVKVTNVAGSVFTVTRAQDGTSAQTWATGSYFELRPVNLALQDLFDEAVADASVVGSELTSTGNITITYDSDNNGAGVFNVLSGADTVLQVTNSGELIASPGYANIKDFGGDATGTSENNTAVTAAIAAGYTAIYFPAGRYKFTSALTFTNTNLTLFGDGPQTSVLFTYHATAGFNLINFTGTYDEFSIDQLTIKDLGIQNECATGAAQGIAINVAHNATASGWKQPNSGLLLERVEVTNAVDDACFATCVQIDSTPTAKIINSSFNGFMLDTYPAGTRAGKGIKIISRYTTNNNVKGTDINISDCVFFQCTTSIDINNDATSTNNFVEGVHIDGCTLLNCNIGVKAGEISTSPANGIPGWFIQGNHITATDYGIDIQNHAQFVIENNLIYGVGGTTFSAIRVYGNVDAGSQTNGLIADNSLLAVGSYSGNKYGVNLLGGDATPGTMSIRVSNNAFEAFTYAGICDANTTGVVITPDNRVLSGGAWSGTLGTTNLAAAFNGSVGIDTTPAYKLHVYNAAADAVTRVESGAGYGGLSLHSSGTNSNYMFFSNATNAERARILVDDLGRYYFYGPSVAERFIIGSTGNVYLPVNGGGIAFKDSGGTDHIVLQYWTDDAVYLSNPKSGENIYSQVTDNGAWVWRNTTSVSDRLTLAADGRLYGNALHNNAGGVTGTTNQYIASGTYTPTLTGVTNVGASTAYACQWIRVGNVVTVSGLFNIDFTAAAATELGISLPIASNFAATSNCAGTAVPNSATEDSCFIQADTTNDRAQVVVTSVGTADTAYSFTFTYVVL